MIGQPDKFAEKILSGHFLAARRTESSGRLVACKDGPASVGKGYDERFFVDVVVEFKTFANTPFCRRTAAR